MKNFFLIITLVLISIITKSQTTTYYSFPDSAIWKYVIFTNGPFFDGYLIYKLDGDTLVNNIKYSKIYGKCINTTSIQYPYCSNNYELVGALREQNKIIYLLYISSLSIHACPGVEVELYNFNNLDTLHGGSSTNNYCLYNFDHIVSIAGTKIVNGFPRNYYLYSNSSPSEHTILEGIGNIEGGLWANEFYMPPIESIKLICFTDNKTNASYHHSFIYYDNSSGASIPIFDSDTINCETEFNSINNSDSKNDFIKIFPNPSNEFVNIKINKLNLTNGVNINVINTQGAIVYHQKTSDNNIKIDISDISKGIYLVEVYTETDLFYKKIIIQ